MQKIQAISKHIALPLIIILTAMFCVQHCTNKALKQDNERLQINQTALVKDIEAYRLKDSSAVAEITTLQLKKAEFQTLYYKTAKEIKELGVKLNRLQNVTTSQTEHLYVFDTIAVYDSVVNTTFATADTIKCFDYQDDYIRFSGCFADETIFGSKIQTFDTLTTIIHKEYKKHFLFFHWKPYFKVTLHSKNPYSTIIGAENIEILK